MGDMIESVREWSKEFWAKQPICVGYEGRCDGDLEGMGHEPHCPMFGKKPVTLFEFAAAFAEYKLAEAAKDTQRLESSLRESILRGYLFDRADEPLDDYGKRIVRVILAAMEKEPPCQP